MKSKDVKQKSRWSHNTTNSFLSPRTSKTNDPSNPAKTQNTMESRLHTSPKESSFKKNAEFDRKKIITLESDSSESSGEIPSKVILEKLPLEKPKITINDTEILLIPSEFKKELQENPKIDLMKNQKIENPYQNLISKLELTDESLNMSILEEKRDAKKDSIELERSPRNSINPRRHSVLSNLSPLAEKRSRSSTNYPGMDKPFTKNPPKVSPQKSLNVDKGKSLYEKSVKSTTTLFNFGGSKRNGPNNTDKDKSAKKTEKKEDPQKENFDKFKKN